MSTNIEMPSFGSSMGEATLLRWLVAVGEAVQAGQVIAEIETDKAMAELEAPAAGVIESIEVVAGTQAVEVGTVLARLRGAGAEPVPARQPAVEELRQRVSPLARRLAAERDVDLAGLQGSGPAGRIVSRDLPEAQRQGGKPANALSALGYAEGSYSLEPLDEMRRAIARRLVESVTQAPHYSLSVDLDLGQALARRRTINEALPADAARVGLNDLILHACARALMDVPQVNACFTAEGIARHHHADIAVAVALEAGLVTPVVRAAERKSVPEIAAIVRELVQRARARRLKQQELEGGTFSLSNLGMAGIRSFTSILNPPQAGILSVGAAAERPVVVDGELAVANLVTVTLSCDHRVIDGMTGAAFLQALQARLDQPDN